MNCTKGIFRNAAKDIAAGLLITAVVLLVVFAGLQLLANETQPLHDFRASIERPEIVLPDQHIFP